MLQLVEKASGMIDEKGKSKIVEELKSGMII